LKRVIFVVLVSVGILLGVNMVLPFPYGLIIGIGGSFAFSWFWLKKSHPNPSSLTSYKRADPITNKEKEQNKEAYRILKKRYLEGEISREEYDRLRKDFDIDEPGTPTI